MTGFSIAQYSLYSYAFSGNKWNFSLVVHISMLGLAGAQY